MKLYATTTSERASKGQGGNNFLDIELSIGTAKDSHVIAKVMLDAHGFLYLRNGKGEERECYMVQNLDLVRVTDINEKSEKQKGDI